ncbi:MAG: HAMP domain-containing sensor histidine kinase [Bacteroidales bacterium]|nr:HAMP domain-containing sensor histidine kinase [Bacteroidales bacterium]MDY6000893.1 HAMP domain-containing sensor histidine kinase [Candidatus Cryptobacteroides sp.]
MHDWLIIVVAAAVVVLAMVVTTFVVRRNDKKKVDFMLDAIEDGELNFRFSESSRLNRSLNRLRWIFERQRQRNEQESWTKLIRVLTHEIMNTVSPIASLSDALSKYADLPPQEQEMDVKKGLETISASSRDLIKFVETYRELSGVSRPLRKAVMLDDLMNKVIRLTDKQCKDAGTECTYEALTKDIMLYIDESQISRVFINLIKNAVQAGSKHVDIRTYIDNAGETHVRVSDDGAPIPPDVQEQIFVPFFTTKSNGSGIGLSISLQIMNRHGGTISLIASSPSSTTFELLFR